MRALKLYTMKSDGSKPDEDTEVTLEVKDPESGKPFRDEETGEPCVTITCRPITKAKHRQTVQRNTEKVLNPKSRAMEESIDWDGVQDDLVDYAILRWTGLVGSDDKVLQCVSEAKRALPGELSNEVVKISSGGQGVDVSPEMFRAAS